MTTPYTINTLADPQFPYNKFLEFSDYPYRIISHLANNNEEIWKLLYYPDSDAWNKPNLTYDQKVSLIYKGQEDGSTSRVFLDVGQPDVWTKEACIIRVSNYTITPLNRTIGEVSLIMEIFSHYKINTLSNYHTRIDTITTELIKTLNGIEIGSLGKYYFDKSAAFNDRAEQGGQIPFKGRWIIMTMKVG